MDLSVSDYSVNFQNSYYCMDSIDLSLSNDSDYSVNF